MGSCWAQGEKYFALRHPSPTASRMGPTHVLSGSTYVGLVVTSQTLCVEGAGLSVAGDASMVSEYRVPKALPFPD